MTDSQILTIALASVPNVLAVLVGVLINNSRLSDLRADVAANRAEVAGLRTEMNTRLNNLELRLTNMETKFDARFDYIIAKMAEMDNRLTRVEASRR